MATEQDCPNGAGCEDHPRGHHRRNPTARSNPNEPLSLTDPPRPPDLVSPELSRLAGFTMGDYALAGGVEDVAKLRRVVARLVRRTLRLLGALDATRNDLSDLRRRLAPPAAREVGPDAVREGVDFVHLPLTDDQLDGLRDGETIRIEIDPDPALGTHWPTVVVLRQSAGALNPTPSRRSDDS